VVDLGAGDGRFSQHASYNSYQGIEIDQQQIGSDTLPPNAKILKHCAFALDSSDYDACVGNPPYVKHHDLDTPWQERVSKKIESQLGVRLKRTANLFSLFLAQGILVTKADGLVAQIVPYEWVSRPSTEPIRKLIKKHGWNVDIYRFKSSVFPRVLTTACIAVIDKSTSDSLWNYYEINDDFSIKRVRRVTGSRYNVLKYTKRNSNNFAQRGLSPGGNKVFCLTEGERLHHGLKVGEDVLPCITSLKPFAKTLKTLTESSFQKYYVSTGERCWLISNNPSPSDRLKGYLKRVPLEVRNNYTCNQQSPWWNYLAHQAPEILYNPGFVERAPQFIDNRYSVIAVGSAFGIHSLNGISRSALIAELSQFDFKSRLISYAKVLRRVEVNQMNTVLNEIIQNRKSK